MSSAKIICFGLNGLKKVLGTKFVSYRIQISKFGRNLFLLFTLWDRALCNKQRNRLWGKNWNSFTQRRKKIFESRKTCVDARATQQSARSSFAPKINNRKRFLFWFNIILIRKIYFSGKSVSIPIQCLIKESRSQS